MATAPRIRMPSPPDPADHFVAGPITALESQDLIIADGQQVVTRVRITDETRFWMGRVDAPLSLVKAGDFVFARGRLDGTTLISRQAWVNIVSFQGVAARVEPGRCLVLSGGREWEVTMQPETELFAGGEPRTLGVEDIPLRTHLQVIGLWDEQAQRVRGTRLFLPRRPDSLPLPPKPVAP